jgi:hypothetical protein
MMSGPMLSTRLETKQKEFEERYDQIFNVNNKVRFVGSAFCLTFHFSILFLLYLQLFYSHCIIVSYEWNRFKFLD